MFTGGRACPAWPRVWASWAPGHQAPHCETKATNHPPCCRSRRAALPPIAAHAAGVRCTVQYKATGQLARWKAKQIAGLQADMCFARRLGLTRPLPSSWASMRTLVRKQLTSRDGELTSGTVPGVVSSQCGPNPVGNLTSCPIPHIRSACKVVINHLSSLITNTLSTDMHNCWSQMPSEEAIIYRAANEA